MNKFDMERDEKRLSIIQTSFDLFVEQGLEKTSIRDLAAANKMNLNSLYYYFKSKDEIVVRCAEYGLEFISEKLLQMALEGIKDIKKFFSEYPKQALAYKKEMCWTYQVLTSPNYNAIMMEIARGLPEKYDKYNKIIAEIVSCNPEQLKPLIYLTVISVIHYIILENDEYTKSQLQSIYRQITILRVYHGQEINGKDV